MTASSGPSSTPTPDAGARRTLVEVPVRTGEPSDAAFIVEMARLASAVEGRPLPPVDDPQLVRGLPPSPDASVLALDHDGHPVGAAWWHFREPLLVVSPDGAAVPELVVAVVPAARGHGVGHLLLDALAAHAARHGYDQVALNVHIRNPAVRLYSRAGFVVAGKGRGPLGVAMVRRLP
jgi:GNAT superfamily N-acetyltransferase